MIDVSMTETNYTVEPKNIPQATTEFMNRWNQLLGLVTDGHNHTADENGLPSEINQGELVGFVEAGMTYWQELLEHNDLKRPLWQDLDPEVEAPYWESAAASLRRGDQDRVAIEHIMAFINQQLAEDLKRRQLSPEQLKRVEQRRSDIQDWLHHFSENPTPLPPWQPVHHGIPSIVYPKEMIKVKLPL